MGWRPSWSNSRWPVYDGDAAKAVVAIDDKIDVGSIHEEQEDGRDPIK